MIKNSNLLTKCHRVLVTRNHSLVSMPECSLNPDEYKVWIITKIQVNDLFFLVLSI